MFRNENLVQTKGTAIGAPNSYADIAVVYLDQTIIKQKETIFHELLYFGRYRETIVWHYGMVQMKNFRNYIDLSQHTKSWSYVYCGSRELIDMILRFKNLDCWEQLNNYCLQ